ncbi:HAD-IA family hydrolase [Tahibacter caeni]|uniref:HAD-IA family hydrolase n=1 Tax=Tahibacter caeni TaxID=1453545 RepID=UPI0021483EEF|nr:HAD-IA family hydrolase [Tahibacter caeni]
MRTLPAPAALLIDFDGVLRRWPADDALERRHGLPAGSLREIAFDPPLVAALVEGRIDDAAWRTQTAQRLRDRHPAADVAGALAQWSAGIGEIDRDLLALLDASATARRVLVSNGSTRLRGDLAAHGLDAYFHAVVNSSEIGVAKPAAAFFAAALSAAGVDAAQAAFIDDSAGHVAAAAALGLRAHRYVDLAGARAFLRDCGLIPSD